MTMLKKNYAISSDNKGKRYLGLDLDWDYENRTVHISMLDYVTNTLKPSQDQPRAHLKTFYGPRSSMHRMTTIHPSSAKPIRSSSKKSLAFFLYYARAVDLTMLTALGSIATQ